MFDLMTVVFEGARLDAFEADLARKSYALLLEAPADGRLVGFSTVGLADRALPGETVRVVYSGDTVVLPAAWGSSSAPAWWLGLLARFARESPDRRLFWLLVASGFRTWRLLQQLFRNVTPRAGGELPGLPEELIALSAQQFGTGFDARTGVVRPQAPYRLRPTLAGAADRRDDPATRLFLARNPGHGDGDELAGLAEVSVDLLTPLGLRCWRRGERLWRDAETGPPP
jgi:hypothetical protein